MESEGVVDILIATGKYSIYHPTSKRDLLLDYPELRNVREFMEVGNPQKMLFVWFYASRTSRAMELVDDSLRRKYAIRAAFGPRPQKDILKQFTDGSWGPQVEAAIQKMRSYNPGARIMQVLLASNQMDKVKRMLEEEPPTFTNWKAREEYLSTVKKAFELMETLRPLTEPAALGVVERTIEQEEEEGSVMEWLHNKS